MFSVTLVRHQCDQWLNINIIFKCMSFKSMKLERFLCEFFVEGLGDMVLLDNKVCVQIVILMCICYVFIHYLITCNGKSFCFVPIPFSYG